MSSRALAIDHLLETRSLTEPLFALPEAQLARSYAPGKWSMHQLLVHLADHESVTFERMRRVASEDSPALPGYDQDDWTAGTCAQQRSIACAGRLYLASRDGILDLLRILPESADQRSGLHAQRGRMTLLQLTDTWMHNRHHLAQLQAAQAGRTWSPAR